MREEITVKVIANYVASVVDPLGKGTLNSVWVVECFVDAASFHKTEIGATAPIVPDYLVPVVYSKGRAIKSGEFATAVQETVSWVAITTVIPNNLTPVVDAISICIEGGLNVQSYEGPAGVNKTIQTRGVISVVSDYVADIVDTCGEGATNRGWIVNLGESIRCSFSGRDESK